MTRRVRLFDFELLNGSVRRGFTLIEVIAVLGILALGAAVAVPAFRRWVQEDDMTAATRRIEALFQLARDSAVRGGAPVTVVIDSLTGGAWLDAGRAMDTAPSSLDLPASVSVELTRARAQFTIAPGGASFADTLVLRGPMDSIVFSLNPWTGDVVRW